MPWWESWFGEEYLETHAVMLSLVNANSPLVWDAAMVGAARVYAQANQGVLVTPFMLAGAMAPVTTAAGCAWTATTARDCRRVMPSVFSRASSRRLRRTDASTVSASDRTGSCCP